MMWLARRVIGVPPAVLAVFLLLGLVMGASIGIDMGAEANSTDEIYIKWDGETLETHNETVDMFEDLEENRDRINETRQEEVVNDIFHDGVIFPLIDYNLALVAWNSEGWGLFSYYFNNWIPPDVMHGYVILCTIWGMKVTLDVM